MKNYLVSILYFIASSLVCMSAELVVDQSGNSGSFTTISDAINASVDGDVIRVKAGNYDEQVVIDKQITLQGEGYLTTTINYSLGNAVVITSPKGAAIKGFWITASGNGITTVSANTSTNPEIPPGGSTAIRNCAITNCGGPGVSFNGNGALGVYNTLIKDCGSTGIYGKASGQYYNSAIGSIYSLLNANIANSIVVNNGGSGISIDPQSDGSVKISNSTILNNSYGGIHLGSSLFGDGNYAASFTNNIIANNGEYGLSGGGRISYSILWNNESDNFYNYAASGSGVIEQDPLLNNDYTLQETSPGIDAGDPFPGSNDPDGTRNDIGAYGGPDAADWDDFDFNPPSQENPETPNIEPIYSNSFGGASVSENLFVLFPPGAPGEFDLADVYFRPLEVNSSGSEFTDGYGCSVILDQGEGVTFYGSIPLEVGEDYILMRLNVWSSNANISLGLAALDAKKANTLSEADLSGTIGVNLLFDASRFVNQFSILESLYRAERGAIIPVIQVVNSSNANRVTVQFDNFEIYRISEESMPNFVSMFNTSSSNNINGLSYFQFGKKQK